MEKVVLGLGSNLGRRLFNLKKALKFLYYLPGFDFLAFSSVFETEPWGFKNQNNYLNCAVTGLYRFSASELYVKLKEIERKTGRKSRERWHPREIDIDILFYGDNMIKTKNLVIPHPQIKFRNFVLVPLAEIMPGFIHPELRVKLKTLLKNSEDKGRAALYGKNLKQ
jgi:dihydroneopterin aldolase / 2-amino-4-hydroxy-6-hydroxymethyldihydropteridine diphosphokinase